MMEPGKLLEALKAIAVYWPILFVLTTFLLIAPFCIPTPVMSYMGLDILISENKHWISLLCVTSIVFGVFNLWERHRKKLFKQKDFRPETEKARRELKKLCEVILHDYRSQKNKAQELGSDPFHFLSFVPNVLRKWQHSADEIAKLSAAINELPPFEFLKFSLKGDDSTIHTNFLLRDPYRNRKGDSKIGVPDTNALVYRLLEVPKDKSQMGNLAMGEVEAMSLDIHFERIMEQWIMFLDTESES